jgi:hypothetical protein
MPMESVLFRPCLIDRKGYYSRFKETYVVRHIRTLNFGMKHTSQIAFLPVSTILFQHDIKIGTIKENTQLSGSNMSAPRVCEADNEK